MAETEDDAGAPLGVWIGLSAVAAVSFYCQATVTEERFVPALNVVATFFDIPDDVAGATLMAAGASSPELFSSLVALFVTHSALGLGTIVGSEIFNQLVICAGAVYAAKSGKLELDRAVVTREVLFYALAIAGLLFALHDTGPVDDDPTGKDHIFISFTDAAILAAGYVLYVLVCAYFDPIVTFLTRRKGTRPGFGPNYGAISRSKPTDIVIPELPYLYKPFCREPLSNFVDSFGSSIRRSEGSRGSLRGFFRRTSSLSIDSFRWLKVEVDKPSYHHEFYDMEVNAYSETMSCFLWQRSYFYTKARLSCNLWHLRWFTFTADSVYSIPDRARSDLHRMTYPCFTEIEIDTNRLILKVANPVAGKRDFYWLAPSKELFDAVVEKCERIMELRAKRKKESEEAALAAFPPPPVDPQSMDSDPDVSLIEFPWGESVIAVLFHILLFPIKALMQFTIPDVRHLDAEGNPKRGLGFAFLAIFMCLVWLIIGSYAMVSSLENLAELMDIPDAVIGVTVSAAGTSLPNYVASKVAAEQGFGNMAVSNAFGSNTFNIMVGLGWPWVLYIAFVNNFQPYHGLRNEGIVESVIILASVLLVFVVIVLKDNFTLYRWHGTLFLILYAAYLAFAIGQVYL